MGDEKRNYQNKGFFLYFNTSLHPRQSLKSQRLSNLLTIQVYGIKHIISLWLYLLVSDFVREPIEKQREMSPLYMRAVTSEQMG